jgi:undecaprenyl pyrophosphate synthase
MLEICLNLGVCSVTVYAFAIENFKRAPEEVDALALGGGEVAIVGVTYVCMGAFPCFL